MSAVQKELKELTSREYQSGFVTELETDVAPRGLNEAVVRLISSKKNEPQWLLDWRLEAYRHWLTLTEPSWQNAHCAIDYQDIIYYAAPKSKTDGPRSLDEVDPEILLMFNKLGISLAEQGRLSGIAVDAIVDSVSVGTTFKPNANKPVRVFA
jgi:Fe-S cluster assembly protein SufB